jgi:hypothetical protein
VTTHYLYRILVPDGRAYIGRSVRPEARFSQHCRADSGIGQAIRRHGRQNCIFEILDAGTGDDIKDLENRTILKFNTLYPAGYNNARSDMRKKMKQLTVGPDGSIPAYVLRNSLDAIFAPGSSPQTLQNCGCVEMTANAVGRAGIQCIFPGWCFAWGQARFPWEGWRSSVLDLPSLAAMRADSLPSELVRRNRLQQLNEPELASLLASEVSDQGVRAVWGAFGSEGPLGRFVPS